MIELTPTEREILRAIVIDWINEGFTAPPYAPEVYAILEKLGIRQSDIASWYSIEASRSSSAGDHRTKGM